jgi:hypothetical protein
VRSLDLDSWTDKNIMFLEVGMMEKRRKKWSEEKVEE